MPFPGMAAMAPFMTAQQLGPGMLASQMQKTPSSGLQDIGGMMSMAGPWGAVAGAGLGMLGGIMDANAQTDRRTKRRRGAAETARERGRRADLREKQFQGLQSQVESFDKARDEVGGIQQAGRQGILDQERQQLGSLRSQLASSGLTNSSFGASLQSGLASRTQRSLQQLDASLANIFAGLQTGKGQAQAQLGNFYGNQIGQDQDLSQRLFDLWTM